MNKLDRCWQELIDTVMHERMSLTSADFHDDPRMFGDLPQFTGQIFYPTGIPIFVKELH
jgi:hypothetical protein